MVLGLVLAIELVLPKQRSRIEVREGPAATNAVDGEG